ncbi:MAG: phage tail protein [Mariprofundus sp.]|nr:phage tail protein [Mariprofundus sp.]
MAYPLPVFHFRVEWGGTNLGFAEVSGLVIENQLIEYRDGVSPEYSAIKMPGIPKYGNITLKRGIVKEDNQFFDWLNTIKMNKVGDANADRRDLIISLLNENHEPVVVWKATNAFPVKIEGPGLKATGNEVAIESIEVAHEGLTIENG